MPLCCDHAEVRIRKRGILLCVCVVCAYVCVCVCLSVCHHCSHLGMQMWKLLSACIGIGRYWQGLDLNRILNQGLVHELWCDLLTLTPRCYEKSKVKRRLNSAQQIAFQLDSCVYATGQAANRVKTQK